MYKHAIGKPSLPWPENHGRNDKQGMWQWKLFDMVGLVKSKYNLFTWCWWRFLKSHILLLSCVLKWIVLIDSFSSLFAGSFLPPALKRPKQALWCRGSPLVTPSVYRTVQCAGDSNYQQMTVAVPNVDQMATRDVMRVQLLLLSPGKNHKKKKASFSKEATGDLFAAAWCRSHRLLSNCHYPLHLTRSVEDPECHVSSQNLCTQFVNSMMRINACIHNRICKAQQRQSRPLGQIRAHKVAMAVWSQWGVSQCKGH